MGPLCKLIMSTQVGGTAADMEILKGKGHTALSLPGSHQGGAGSAHPPGQYRFRFGTCLNLPAPAGHIWGGLNTGKMVAVPPALALKPRSTVFFGSGLFQAAVPSLALRVSFVSD